MIDSAAVWTFLSGAVGTMSGIAATRWKDYRDDRRRHDLDRRAAYAQLLVAVEEARAVLVDTAQRAPDAALIFDAVRRLFAARSGLVLVEDDEDILKRSEESVRDLSKLLLMLVSREPFPSMEEFQRQVARLVADLEILERKMAGREAVMRATHTSLLPDWLAHRRAKKLEDTRYALWVVDRIKPTLERMAKDKQAADAKEQGPKT